MTSVNTQPAQKAKAIPKPPPKSHPSSVEDSTDEDIYVSWDDTRPKTPSANLEAADGTDDIDEEEEENLQEETDEQELGIAKIQSWNCFINLLYRTTLKRMALTRLCFFQSHSQNQLC